MADPFYHKPEEKPKPQTIKSKPVRISDPVQLLSIKLTTNPASIKVSDIQAVSILINGQYAKKAADLLEKVAIRRKDLSRACLDILFEGLENSATAVPCANSICHIVQKYQEVFEKSDAQKLTKGLSSPKIAEDCAVGIAWLAKYKPQLFDSKMLDVLYIGLGSKEISEACISAISFLSTRASELFTNDHIRGLYRFFNNHKLAKYSISILDAISKKHPEFFTTSDLAPLIAELKEKEFAGRIINIMLRISNHNPKIFDSSSITMLTSLFSNLVAGPKSATILEHIITEFPISAYALPLFDKKHALAIAHAYSNKSEKQDCAMMLNVLAKQKSLGPALPLPQDQVVYFKKLGIEISDEFSVLLGWLCAAGIKPIRSEQDAFAALEIFNAGGTMKDIEYALDFMRRHPEDFNELWGNCGIRHFARYDDQILIHAAAHSRNPQLDPKSPLAVFSFAQSDHNGAFYNNAKSLHKFISNGYRLLIFESGSENLLVQMLTDARRKHGLFDVAIFAGHGSSSGIQLSNGTNQNDSQLDNSDSKSLALLAGCMAKKSTIILNSCSTGQERIFTKSIAESFTAAARKSGSDITVLAPKKPTTNLRFVFRKGVFIGANTYQIESASDVQMAVLDSAD